MGILGSNHDQLRFVEGDLVPISTIWLESVYTLELLKKLLKNRETVKTRFTIMIYQPRNEEHGIQQPWYTGNMRLLPPWNERHGIEPPWNESILPPWNGESDQWISDSMGRSQDRWFLQLWFHHEILGIKQPEQWSMVSPWKPCVFSCQQRSRLWLLKTITTNHRWRWVFASEHWRRRALPGLTMVGFIPMVKAFQQIAEFPHSPSFLWVFLWKITICGWSRLNHQTPNWGLRES